MELKELEYIVAIAEEGSISKAAARLYLAQSSLSQFLSRYEAELNAHLFVRTTGGVRLTRAGEVFVRNARQMLWQYHRVKSELNDMDQPGAGRIEFGISSFRGGYLLPGVLQQFREKYPEVEVVIHEHDSSALMKKLAAGELDAALVAFQSDEQVPPNRSVMRDEVLLVAAKDHPVMAHVRRNPDEPGRAWVELADTLQYEYLLSNGSTMLGSIAQRLFATCGKQPRVINGNLTASFAAAMARQGLGLALTYRSCAQDTGDAVYLSIGKERCYVDLVLMYPPDGYRSRALRALEEMVRLYMVSVNEPS